MRANENFVFSVYFCWKCLFFIFLDVGGIFRFIWEYLGFFKIENMKSFNKDRLSSEGAKIIFPFARSIIATITQNGGNIPIVLDNVDFSLIKS